MPSVGDTPGRAAGRSPPSAGCVPGPHRVQSDSAGLAQSLRVGRSPTATRALQASAPIAFHQRRHAPQGRSVAPRPARAPDALRARHLARTSCVSARKTRPHPLRDAPLPRPPAAKSTGRASPIRSPLKNTIARSNFKRSNRICTLRPRRSRGASKRVFLRGEGVVGEHAAVLLDEVCVSCILKGDRVLKADIEDRMERTGAADYKA